MVIVGVVNKMGNRAVITTENKKIGIYLHWNGGRDSVEAFLKYCELKNYSLGELELIYDDVAHQDKIHKMEVNS